MQTLRNPDRRSFLARVLGGAALVGAGLILGAEGTAQRQKAPSRRMIVDRDPGDPAREPPPPPRPTNPDPPAPPTTVGDAVPSVNSHHRVQSAAPSTQRFVICPGNRRCPPR